MTTKTTKRKNNVDANIIDAYVNATTYENDATRENVRRLLHALSQCDDMKQSKKIRRALRALNHRRAMNIVVEHHFNTTIAKTTKQ